MLSPASRTSTPLPGSPTPRPQSPLSSAASPVSDISGPGASLSPHQRPHSPPPRVPAIHPGLLHHHNSHVMPRPSFMISDILNDSLRPGKNTRTTPSPPPPPVSAVYRHHPLLHPHHPGALPPHLEALAAAEERARAEKRNIEEEDEDLDVEFEDDGEEGRPEYFYFFRHLLGEVLSSFNMLAMPTMKCTNAHSFPNEYTCCVKVYFFQVVMWILCLRMSLSF